MIERKPLGIISSALKEPGQSDDILRPELPRDAGVSTVNIEITRQTLAALERTYPKFPLDINEELAPFVNQADTAARLREAEERAREAERVVSRRLFFRISGKAAKYGALGLAGTTIIWKLIENHQYDERPDVRAAKEAEDAKKKALASATAEANATATANKAEKDRKEKLALESSQTLGVDPTPATYPNKWRVRYTAADPNYKFVETGNKTDYIQLSKNDEVSIKDTEVKGTGITLDSYTRVDGNQVVALNLALNANSTKQRVLLRDQANATLDGKPLDIDAVIFEDLSDKKEFAVALNIVKPTNSSSDLYQLRILKRVPITDTQKSTAEQS